MEMKNEFWWYTLLYNIKKIKTVKRFTYKNWDKKKLKWWLFEIDLNTFIELMKSDCHYCWLPPKERKFLSSNKRYYTYLLLQSIDRVSCDTGYTFYNVVPCCMKCNALKAYMSYDEFQKRKQEIFYYAEWKTYSECYTLWLKFWRQIHPDTKRKKFIW